MEVKQITVTVHRRARKVMRSARLWAALRRWAAGVNWWRVAWYALLTVAGVLLYRVGAVYALRQRGYYAVGGEAVALLLPVFYWLVSTLIRDFLRDL